MVRVWYTGVCTCMGGWMGIRLGYGRLGYVCDQKGKIRREKRGLVVHNCLFVNAKFTVGYSYIF